MEKTEGQQENHNGGLDFIHSEKFIPIHFSCVFGFSFFLLYFDMIYFLLIDLGYVYSITIPRINVKGGILA